MDMTELMTKKGMSGFKDEQRDTFVNDATELRQMGRIIYARIAQTEIDGDKPWSAKRRAAQVRGRFNRVAKLLEKAAAEVEAIDATYNRRVLELPERRAKAIERKNERREVRALTRQKAHALTTRTLTESAQHLAVDPRTAGQQPPAAAPQVVYNSPHPQAYATAPANTNPLPEFSEAFGSFGETG